MQLNSPKKGEDTQKGENSFNYGGGKKRKKADFFIIRKGYKGEGFVPLKENLVYSKKHSGRTRGG